MSKGTRKKKKAVGGAAFRGNGTSGGGVLPKVTEVLDAYDAQKHWGPICLAAAVLSVLFMVSYWPTLVWMEYQWRNEPDYSHGYLIIPLAIVLLYARSNSFPGLSRRISWAGAGLLLLAGFLRIFASLSYMEFLDGWSIVLWVAGAVWMLAGRSALIWALPAIFFLILLVPLPFQIESMLSGKLQSIVTLLGTGCLRVLGFPAIAEGNTIWVGEKHMLVEEACSGLRIFVGMAAFAFFWASMAQRAWIDKVVILLSALPMAILANTIRVVLTCGSYYWLNDSWSRQLHDGAGILMIFIAGGLLWCVKTYWELLYHPTKVVLPVSQIREELASFPQEN
jgi:exosortase